jgi:predicted DNA-binding protein with PD1-like motif
MNTIGENTYKPGKRYLIELPGNSDIITFIKTTCFHKGIETASFAITGSISFATIGVYDQKQQVFVSHIEKVATEILSCAGNITPRKDDPHVTAKIILADQQGQLTGGHLFSETIVAFAELDLQELLGVPLQRNIIPQTLMSTS